MVEVSLTVGKLDASIAVLLTSSHHLIEFPSILLPPAVQAGSIVKIRCERDVDSERKEEAQFEQLQEQIYEMYGQRSPVRPELRVRNATQTSIVLEWDPVELGTAELRSLYLYRNGQRLGQVPSPLTNTSSKLSGLSIDTAYTFHLQMHTSAGTYTSEKITVKTHKMTDLTGITVCAGAMADADRQMLDETVARIGAKPVQDRVRNDTTHFVCTAGEGSQWERAVETNVPVVRPEWLQACESEGRIVGVRAYYLDADPKLRPPIRELPQRSPTTPVVTPGPTNGPTGLPPVNTGADGRGEIPEVAKTAAAPEPAVEPVPEPTTEPVEAEPAVEPAAEPEAKPVEAVSTTDTDTPADSPSETVPALSSSSSASSAAAAAVAADAADAFSGDSSGDITTADAVSPDNDAAIVADDVAKLPATTIEPASDGLESVPL
ncbi:uncharacterized protein V1510DRAFT_419826 [Dipodascopsis tothii]|uniref:uncharacterized protein n=1 Tax=Dipodascopsis tothii TaxID=44089 RepID=UPI0034CDE354